MLEEKMLRLSDAFENGGVRAEVLGMLLEEFDVKKYERTLRSEGREKGREEGIREGMEQGVRCMVEALQEAGQTKDFAAGKIMEKFALSEAEAQQKLLRYWK